MRLLKKSDYVSELIEDEFIDKYKEEVLAIKSYITKRVANILTEEKGDKKIENLKDKGIKKTIRFIAFLEKVEELVNDDKGKLEEILKKMKGARKTKDKVDIARNEIRKLIKK